MEEKVDIVGVIKDFFSNDISEVAPIILGVVFAVVIIGLGWRYFLKDRD